MFLKSIRFKITILYMAILAITLTSFSVILYHNVSSGLYTGMDTLLTSRAGGIVRAIDTYWEASSIEAIEKGEKPEALRKRRNFNFAKIAQKWVREESTDPALLDIIVHVFDTDGAIISSSKNTQSLNEISRNNFLSVLQGKARFDTVSFENQANSMVFRVYTTPVFENEKVAYIVQVASPLTSINTALNKLKIALFILFPITVLLTGMMGAFLAKVTLGPVNNMIKTIHQITAENMKLKLGIPDTKDEIQKLAETFNDMLQRLEKAFTSQRKLFEDLSHELKTPLTILRGEFEVILKKVRSSEEYESVLKSALEEIKRISKLADNMLLLARFESKEAFPEKRLIGLNRLVDSAIKNIRSIAGLKEISVSFSPAADFIVDADETQMRALLFNILENAVKYTPPKGDVRVSLQRIGQSVRIAVSDSGIGMSKEELDHVFDRFYRVEKSRNSAGFGLGLSIAKSIADAHGGTIGAVSEPQKGTTFLIDLPIASG
jgi:heavy metal sensor kinase